MSAIVRLRTHWGTRPVHAALACLLAGALAWHLVLAPSTWPWVLLAAFAPDLPLLAGMSHDGVRGRLRPSAVPAYNALHTYWGPALLAAVSPLLGAAALSTALAWSLHIAVDRTLGYGLRTRAGDQRPRG